MMTRSIRILAALASLSFAAPAFAADLCKPADGPAKPESEIRAMLEGQGYQIRKIATEDGCIEMKGTDKAGKRAEVYVHPVTGEIVKVK
ncbi:PepSY domain-containing protein [Magnetospirillum molischianum]|uniref:PepSY domain-containing protein n=1 Tax=Magnetospirillum molischianum DSM 120 TaxID=1150626 RepID=H8FS13_MAGML|nr:PepSY domain-containing protein [Magnetospirillum molischianum]CCG41151.1 conserved exported hypothetical protein [Magnetospirillum molischianum DSM 120]